MEIVIIGFTVGLSAATCLIYRLAAALQERP